MITAFWGAMLALLFLRVLDAAFGGRLRPTVKKDLLEMEKRIMAAIDDVRAELGKINATTNEIAADIDELITKIGQPGGMSEAEAQEVVESLKGVSTTLQGVAAKYPVPPPA